MTIKKLNIMEWVKKHPMFIMSCLMLCSSFYSVFKSQIDAIFGVTRGERITAIEEELKESRKQHEIYFHLWLGETEKTDMNSFIRSTNHGGLFYFDKKTSRIWGVSHSGEGIGDYMYINGKGEKIYIK